MTSLLWVAFASLVFASLLFQTSKSSRLTPKGADMVEASAFTFLLYAALCVVVEIALWIYG